MELSVLKWGNSAGLRLPATLLKQVDASIGSTFDVTVTKNGVLLKPKRRVSYKLSDLLKQCKQNQPLPQDLLDWEKSEPVGNEK